MPNPRALYSAAEIRAIEQAAYATFPPGILMERAGAAAATWALELVTTAKDNARILILAGPGNNGGDALEAGWRLAQSGAEVIILSFADPATQPADARLALAHAQNSNAQFVDCARWSELLATPWSLVIDGLFGIGLTRPITGPLQSLVAAVNALTCPILALDVPSGLDADTGNIVGDDGIAVRASHTLTFIGDKPGLHTGHGRDYAGSVRVDHLQLDETYFVPVQAELNDVQLFAACLRPRPHNSHKGSFGDVTVGGGARGMGGAAILAARAAAKCGAGRVFVAFLEDPPAYDSVQPELMCRSAREHDPGAGTLVVGPGLGLSDAAADLLDRALDGKSPLVLDADALNLLAASPALHHKAAQRTAPLVMTPHPLEAARLMRTTSAAVQADRIGAARTLAQTFNGIIILKGSGTVIARPDGTIVINPTGNPALATAGTGDVLAGVCGALLAQRCPAWESALAATWLHGHAADVLVEQGFGPVGLTASELIPCIRTSLNKLINEHTQRCATR
jgi:hydroxyethylthiazole kinase-like uncharacterized protein yjeF